MTITATIQFLRRTLCLIALVAYAICLYFAMFLLLGHAFHPLIDRHWPLIVSILLRWIPVMTFVWLWYRPVYVSRRRRGCAVLLAAASISLSYFLICFAADGLFRFGHGFLEGTMDLWPAIVMLLTVKSRSARFPNSLPNVDTPIA